jgi:RNA polymerase sigma factor (TIGR02999 family)
VAEPKDMTVLLKRASSGDREAQNELAPLVYATLKSKAEAMMRGEQRSVSVQATVLVNDAFMRLVDGAAVDWQSRTHFYATASRVMRRVLVDHARARSRLKRGGGAGTVQLDEALTVSVESDNDILKLDEALTRLAEIDPEQAEMVTMRFFGGMSVQGVADALGRSKRSVEREWSMIKAWLRQEMTT